MTIKKVSIAQIDLKNDQFQLSYLTDRSRLTESIRKVGLLHPVILRLVSSTDCYQIVSGFQRVRSCIELNMERIDGVIYEPDELPDWKALLLSVHQTATSRNLNLMEKSLALRKLGETGEIKKAELVSDIMPLLGLEPSEKVLGNVVRLAELTDGVKAYIVENGVALGNAVRFLEFSPADQRQLLELILPLKLGTNRLREFLTLIDEICRRDDIAVRKIVDRQTEAILADPNIPGPQKAGRIRGRLREKRFPRTVASERELRANLKQLKLPPELSLTPPPFFEGGRLKLELTFEKVEELKRIIKKLADISDRKELKEILGKL